MKMSFNQRIGPIEDSSSGQFSFKFASTFNAMLYFTRSDEHEVKLCGMPQSLRKKPKTFNEAPTNPFHFTKEKTKVIQRKFGAKQGP